MAPPWMRASSRLSQSSFRSLRMVCGVTSKRCGKLVDHHPARLAGDLKNGVLAGDTSIAMISALKGLASSANPRDLTSP